MNGRAVAFIPPYVLIAQIRGVSLFLFTSQLTYPKIAIFEVSKGELNAGAQ
jgi:MFS superfamily sulfate permease-like transporter